jgi:Fe-S-cluster-containing hydrogenase component 2
MELLNVDQEKCKRDGICAAVCPMQIIELKTKEAFPTMIDSVSAAVIVWLFAPMALSAMKSCIRMNARR